MSNDPFARIRASEDAIALGTTPEKYGFSPQTAAGKLRRIAAIIEAVDNRCMAIDGAVTPTLQEMTQAEISEIYRLSSGSP